MTASSGRARLFVRVALLFLVLCASLGLVLRANFLARVPGLTFAYGVHAHSHTMYFGWAGLALSALWLGRLGALGQSAHAALWALVAIASAGFITFLEGGYWVASIAVSTAALVAWSWIGVLLWRASSKEPTAARGFLRAGVVYLFLAISGAIARVVLLAGKIGDEVDAALAVFAFIHNFAWFLLLGTIGLLRSSAAELGLSFDDRRLRLILWGMAGAAWLTFPLGVSGADRGALSGSARVASFAVAGPGLLWAWTLFRASHRAPAGRRWALGLVAGWAALHALGEVGGALGLAPLATALRHPAVLYLHVLLVGSISFPLLLFAARALGRPEPNAPFLNAGLATMCLGLAMASIPAYRPSMPLWLSPAGLWLAAIGGALLLAAFASLAFRPSGERRPLAPPEPSR